jgi:hypothetical protein
MSGLENLQTRLQYKGGNAQIDRMKKSKVDTLKRALLYSYQSATAILNDGREFRCLINKDKTKLYSDDKVISIPFEDICLNEKELKGVPIGKYKTSEGTQVIGMKPGDVFTWKDTHTHWIVYLQKLEETAYFRAEIRQCNHTLDVNGKEYRVYARKKALSEIPWTIKSDLSFSELDYGLEMYITKDEITQDRFKRFDIIKLNGQPWEVQAVDAMSVEGIVMVALKEHYNNTIEEKIEEEKKQEPAPEIKPTSPHIEGDTEVYPYDTKVYTIKGIEGGNWFLDSKKAVIVSEEADTATVEITTGRSGEFELKYIKDETEVALNVTIKSL